MHLDVPAELVETKKSLCRRSIDQLAYIKEVNSLLVLSGQTPFAQSENTVRLNWVLCRDAAYPLPLPYLLPSDTSGENQRRTLLCFAYWGRVLGRRSYCSIESWYPREGKRRPGSGDEARCRVQAKDCALLMEGWRASGTSGTFAVGLDTKCSVHEA